MDWGYSMGENCLTLVKSILTIFLANVGPLTKINKET